eukprot:5280499-Amphidinium_carterae.1
MRDSEQIRALAPQDIMFPAASVLGTNEAEQLTMNSSLPLCLLSKSSSLQNSQTFNLTTARVKLMITSKHISEVLCQMLLVHKIQ